MEHLIAHHTSDALDVVAILKQADRYYTGLVEFANETSNWKSEKPSKNVTKLDNYFNDSTQKVIILKHRYSTQLKKIQQFITEAQNDPTKKTPRATIKQLHITYLSAGKNLTNGYNQIQKTFNGFFQAFKPRLTLVPEELNGALGFQQICVRWLTENCDIIQRHFSSNRR